MNDMADRMHTALMDAFDLLLGMLPDGRVEERNGYRLVSAPSFPVPIANCVWVDGPDAPARLDHHRSRRRWAKSLAMRSASSMSPRRPNTGVRGTGHGRRSMP